jgi:hypothetical protein
MRFKLDHSFWMAINMFQTLRLMPLMQVKNGLILRQFLNKELQEFMIQLDIALLPEMLFEDESQLPREFRLFGFQSYKFMYFFITAVTVILMTAFALTFALAVLECLKRTKFRLKLMIALATYLSLNLWIRGAFEFSLSLFMVALLDIDFMFEDNMTLLSLGSKFFLGVFVFSYIGMMVGMILYFVKKKKTEAWPKGILEFYEPLKPVSRIVIAYNCIFVAKRIIFAFNSVWLGFLSANTQLLIQIVTILAPLLLSICLVRFRSIITVMYYMMELICLVSFSLMFLYENQNSTDKAYTLNLSKDEIDRIIIIFISSSFTILIIMYVFESGFGFARYIKERRAIRTGARAPQGPKNYIVDENGRCEVQKRPNFKSDVDVGIMKPSQTAEIMKVEDYDDLIKHKQSMISDNSISPALKNSPSNDFRDIGTNYNSLIFYRIS